MTTSKQHTSKTGWPLIQASLDFKSSWLVTSNLLLSLISLLILGCKSSVTYIGDRSPVFELHNKLGTTPELKIPDLHMVSSTYEGYLVSIEKIYHPDLNKWGWKKPNVYTETLFKEKPVFDFAKLQKQFIRPNYFLKTEKILVDNIKVQIVTQITHLSANLESNTFSRHQVYDIYRGDKPSADMDDESQGRITKPAIVNRPLVRDLMDNGAAALITTLVDDMTGLLKKAENENQPYTHIIVLSTGWNTPLWESAVNYGDWQRVIDGAAKEQGKSFKPLYIGVSWPSDWNIKFKFFSFFNKADDADELGLTWINILVNQTIPEVLNRAQNPPKLVAMGHSFGSRVLTRALNSSAALTQTPLVTNRFDHYIGLESAFSASRFFDHGKEGSPYARTYKDRVEQYVFVTSSHDEAVTSAPATWYTQWLNNTRDIGVYLGDPKVEPFIKHYCKDQGEFSPLLPVGKNGTFNMDQKRQEPIWILDASSIVKQNVYETGGGAHSDVFNQNVGHLIANIIFQN